jgi:carbohydrate-binding DOMON domain-containing protein
MKKSHFLLIIVFLIVYSILQSGGATEEEPGIFAITDPVGDDNGPGTYQYPTNEVFRSDQGLFDLTGFSIKNDGEDYLLRFSFAELTDPWKGKFGFSLPLIQVYIDNLEGGSIELFREGANVRLDSRHPWDKLLKLSGWWLRVYQPADRDKKDDFWEMEENPWEVSDAQVETVGNDILLRINQDITGRLEGAHLFLLVGGFDPFGPDHFRKIEGQISSWVFADLRHDNLSMAPRVIDLVLPAGREQSKVLADFNENYPVIYPVYVRDPGQVLFSLNTYLYLIFSLFLLIFLVRKRKPL